MEGTVAGTSIDAATSPGEDIEELESEWEKTAEASDTKKPHAHEEGGVKCKTVGTHHEG